MFLTIITFIVVLGILVFVHEFGHFVTAKLAGVKVLEFAIGFPPRIFTFKKRETQYTIGAIPIGGYVKMLGEDENSKDPRAFNNQSPGKRFVIGVAGVIMNFILAWLLLTIGFSAGMSPIITPPDQIPGERINTKLYIVEVEKGSPAEKAGIEVGDKLIGQDSAAFSSATNVSDFTKDHLGQTVDLKIERDSKILDKKVELASANKETPLGVGIVEDATVRVAWYRAPDVAFVESGKILKYTFSFLGGFVKQLFSSGVISNDVGGPVAIFRLTGMAASAGIIILLQFVAILSLNLALINILPFPALDGGRVLFVILEKIAGRRILKEKIEGMIHMIGFVFLILLILAITYKDIARLFIK